MSENLVIYLATLELLIASDIIQVTDKEIHMNKIYDLIKITLTLAILAPIAYFLAFEVVDKRYSTLVILAFILVYGFWSAIVRYATDSNRFSDFAMVGLGVASMSLLYFSFWYVLVAWAVIYGVTNAGLFVKFHQLIARSAH